MDPKKSTTAEGDGPSRNSDIPCTCPIRIPRPNISAIPQDKPQSAKTVEFDCCHGSGIAQFTRQV